MKQPKFGRGDTIKILPDTPFNRSPGSLFIVRNVFEFSNLNETVKNSLKDIMTINDDTPVYYCSDEINYNCFVPESYVEKGIFFRADRDIVEPASHLDKLYLRVAMIAEALRNKADKHSHRQSACDRFRREDVKYGDEPVE